MNRKLKFLTPILCGLLLSSSLAFTSVQAATTKSDTQVNTSTQVTTDASLSLAISLDGNLYFSKITGAKNYYIIIVNASSAKLFYADYINPNTTPPVKLKSYFAAVGAAVADYSIELKALDSNNNPVADESIMIHYDGSNFTQKY